VAQVSISIPLIERLLRKYPYSIGGIKDSSGDWNNTKAVLDAFGGSGFDVFVGSEVFLLANMRAGGAGCISATANVNPKAIHTLWATWRQADADAQQATLNAVRAEFQKRPMIAALKQAIAHWGAVSAWTTLRPPLVELSEIQRAELIGSLEKLGFDMPGLTA
jgi:4-hydroxy-tetrahydrodipicolinate synthase